MTIKCRPPTQTRVDSALRERVLPTRRTCQQGGGRREQRPHRLRVQHGDEDDVAEDGDDGKRANDLQLVVLEAVQVVRPVHVAAPVGPHDCTAR